MPETTELEGLTVRLDQLLYTQDEDTLPEETPHAFIYHLTITNNTSLSLTLIGRKWILTYEDGECAIFEGDRIIGQTPHLKPGESFSYNSYHVVRAKAKASGAFYGLDEKGRTVHVKIPPFDLTIPA